MREVRSHAEPWLSSLRPATEYHSSGFEARPCPFPVTRRPVGDRNRNEARAETLRKTVGGLWEVLGIELDDRKRQALAAMSDSELDALFDTLTRERRWPG